MKGGECGSEESKGQQHPCGMERVGYGIVVVRLVAGAELRQQQVSVYILRWCRGSSCCCRETIRSFVIVV